MAKYDVLFNYFRGCPYLSKLMSIAAEAEKGNTVILPQGASPTAQYDDKIDVTGYYTCNIIPYPTIYEDFQINCYEWYDVKDNNPPASNENVLTYEEVCGVCDWVNEQNNLKNFPAINEQVVAIECNPFVPQIRYADEKTQMACYFITVRIYYVNRMRKQRFIDY